MDQIDDVSKVISRAPAEITPCPFIDVDAVNARKHRPSAVGVHVFVTGHTLTYDLRRIKAEFLQVIAREGRRRAHNVATEPDGLHSLETEKMRVDDVFNVRSPVEK